MTTDFTHLHTHTDHSILDGYTKTKELPHIIKSLGQNAVGMTDHGSLGGLLDFEEGALEAEVKAIAGVEAYVTPDISIKTKESETWHLVLLAQNQVGRNNLFALSKIGWVDGFYSKPRVDYARLSQHSEGIICLSACMAGETARAIAENDFDEAKAALLRYAAIYDDRFYVELQPGNDPSLNASLANLAADLGLRTVVTVDSHYDHAHNKPNEELLLVMQQTSAAKASDRDYAFLMHDEAKRKGSLVERLNCLWPRRKLRYDKLELHLMSRDEVVRAMDRQGFDGTALADATLEIAERCESVKFQRGASYLPKINDLDGDDYLEELVMKGLRDRGLHKNPAYLERVREELDVIQRKKFSDYFLIVWDIFNEARSRNIYVGPGRGSAAGSLVCYSLRITNIDPIKYKLLFFRFLDDARDDWPDIDMDFEHTGRDEMKRYVEEKYGEKLSLATYSEFKGKALFASICKALGFKEAEIRAVTKHFADLDQYETAEGTKSFRTRHPEVGLYCRALEGKISQTGMHAAAVVVADRPMSEIVPIESRTDPEDKKQRVQVAGFNMGDAEKVGLIKFDFLGLINLSIIHSCVDLIQERYGVLIDWENLEPDDPEVFEMLNGSNTVGVFQMESTAFRNLIKSQGIANFEDMSASNALVRPGAFDTVAKEYERRKKGIDPVTYPHPAAEEWLCDTYGLYIYQEQVMALSVVLGDFTWQEANKLRKIIGKKRDAAEFMPYFNKWMEGAGPKIGDKEAEEMWHNFEKHAGYSFNRSHAISYSYIGYVTAWLKLRYPIEYMYSMLKHEKSSANKMTYLLEAKRLGINIIPPDVNTSDTDMSVYEDSLLFGLTDVLNVGVEAAKTIIANRPVEKWEDFGTKIPARKCNSKVIESLVAVNALRSIDDAPHNTQPEENYMKYLNYPLALEYVKELGIEYQEVAEYDEEEKDNWMIVCGAVKSVKRTDRYVRLELEDISGTLTCFGSMTNDLSSGELVLALVGEKTMLGYARVDGLKERMESKLLHPFEKLLTGKLFEDVEELKKWGIGGINDSKSLVAPLSIRRITTKTSKRMAFAYITDGELLIKLTIFPREWEKLEGTLEEFKPVCMKLRWLDDGGRTVNASDVIDAADLLQQQKDRTNG